MYGYKVISTIDVAVYNSRIHAGSVLYSTDENQKFATYDLAREDAKSCVANLHGSKEFNTALVTSEIHVYEV